MTGTYINQDVFKAIHDELVRTIEEAGTLSEKDISDLCAALSELSCPKCTTQESVLQEEVFPEMYAYIAQRLNMAVLSRGLINALASGLLDIIARKELLFLIDAADKSRIVLTISGFQEEEQAGFLDVLIDSHYGSAE